MNFQNIKLNEIQFDRGGQRSRVVFNSYKQSLITKRLPKCYNLKSVWFP